MHAIINQKDGSHYVSAVFGYYKNISATDDYQRYLESIYNPYYVVWDATYTKLVKQLVMVPDTKYMIRQVLIIDTDRSDWTMNDDGEGCVNFLDKDLIDMVVDDGELPTEIMQKCKSAYSGFVYNDTTEIKNQHDIENLMWASGGFHDARIVNVTPEDDGTLHIHFDGTWSCEIDVWFWGELEYDISSRYPAEYDPYWFGSSVFFHDGYVYFVDEYDMTVDRIGPGYCYFKARHMKYRIIPDKI